MLLTGVPAIKFSSCCKAVLLGAGLSHLDLQEWQDRCTGWLECEAGVMECAAALSGTPGVTLTPSA
jgi:hypothetical protein